MESSDDEILKILRSIEKRLDNIEIILDDNRNSAKKMSNHIDFIDHVYDNVKMPFCKILSMYNGNTVKLEKNLIEDSREK